MENVIVVNAGKSNAHSPGSIAFVVWIAFSKSVKNHIAHSFESFSSSTTWTECFRAFSNFEITPLNRDEALFTRGLPNWAEEALDALMPLGVLRTRLGAGICPPPNED